MLTKATEEAALNAELDSRLGYDKQEKTSSDNNAYGRMTSTFDFD